MRVCCFLFAWLLLSPAGAAEVPRAGVMKWSVVLTDESRPSAPRPLRWRSLQKFEWKKNAAGVFVLESLVILEAPFKIEDASPQISETAGRLTFKDRRMLISDSAQDLTIAFKKPIAGQPAQVRLRIAAPKDAPRSFIEKCADTKLTFAPVGEEAPFYLGAYCELKANKEVNFHLTFPSNVELADSTLFESEGKGEHYRLFDLKKINAATSELAHFTFVSGGKKYIYALSSSRGESESQKVVARYFAVGLGYTTLGFSTPGASSSDAKPLLRGQMNPYPVFGRFGVGGVLEYALGLSSSSSSISYLQLAPFLAYRWALGARWEFQPRLSYVIASQQQSGSGVGFQISQIGIGAALAWQMTDQSALQIEFMTASMGSPVIKSHQMIDAQFSTGRADSRLSWGGGVKMQNYSVADSSSIESKYSQLGFYGLVGF